MVTHTLQASEGEHLSTSTPLRVLHVLEATLGGTLRYLENIAEALTGPEFQFGFAYGSSRADSRLAPFLARIEAAGWDRFPLSLRREIAPRTEISSLLELRAVIRRFRPDILHCHSSKAGVTGRVVARLVRPSPRVIYSPHALAIALGKKFLLIEKSLASLTDRYLAVSESEAAEILGHHLAPAADISVAYPMINTDYFTPQIDSQADPQSPIILGIGRLTAQKNPLSFIRIVREVQRRSPGTRGIWLGDGELADAFRLACREHPELGAIELVPWQHDVRPYLRDATALLSTSAYESFGYMVAEALAMEVPVVATRVNGTCDILRDAFAASTYPLGEEHAAVALLTGLLADTPRAARLSAEGRAMVQARFGPHVMAAALTAVYRQTIAGDVSIQPSRSGHTA